MSTVFSNITFPFVYFDSSFLLRHPDYNPTRLSKNHAIKHPDKFIAELKWLAIASQADANYYKQIDELQQNRAISMLITCETSNQTILQKQTPQITLFGTMPAFEEITFPPLLDLEIGNLVLWGEKIDIKTYNQATLIIAQAPCIVIDPCILTVAVGKSLINCVSTKCNIIVLSKTQKRFHLNVHYTVLSMTPMDFIHKLAISFN